MTDVNRDLQDSVDEWRGLPRHLRDDLLGAIAVPLRLHGTWQFAERVLRAAIGSEPFKCKVTGSLCGGPGWDDEPGCSCSECREFRRREVEMGP
jgi:hypothetical protein